MRKKQNLFFQYVVFSGFLRRMYPVLSCFGKVKGMHMWVTECNDSREGGGGHPRCDFVYALYTCDFFKGSAYLINNESYV